MNTGTPNIDCHDIAPRATGSRHRPPARRHAETRRIRWKDQTVHISIGYDASGLTPVEIFYSAGYRSGADMETLVSDLCIALSVMIQHEGITAASLSKSMSTAFDLRTGKRGAGSILGLLLTELERAPAWADAVKCAEAEGREHADGR